MGCGQRAHAAERFTLETHLRHDPNALPVRAQGRTADPFNLRLLMVTPFFVPHLGGVERYVEMLSRRLAEREGIDVTVLTTDAAAVELRRQRIGSVEIIKAPAWPRGADYLFAPRIYSIVRSGQWDLVHVQSYHTFVAPLAMLGALRAHLPYVVTFHGGGHSSWLRRLIRRPQLALLRPLLVRASRLVALARFEIEVYGAALKVPAERFEVIPQCTDFVGDHLTPPSGGESAPVIASLGRLERYKGHHRLIEALPSILRVRPDARVWIAGTGPYREALEQLTRDLGMTERVEIRAIPADDQKAMAEELSKVALVVLLSDYETQPLVVVEALALRRPVLITDTRGLDEFAQRGLVRSIPSASGPEDVAAAVLEQLRKPFIPARMDVPTWAECAARHDELYASIVRRARG